MRYPILALALLLLTAACGEAGPQGSAAPPPAAAERPEGGQSAGEPQADNEAAHGGDDANATDEAGLAAPEGERQAPDAEPEPEQPVKPLYRMNAAYRFEPIDAETPKQVVLLTFDDGPKESDMLGAMLDTLDKHQAKAVFFVNGYRAAKQPELLALIRERGHMIGNHSWDHIDLKKEDEATVTKQIRDVQELVEQHAGTRPTLFRPPFGSGGDAVKAVAAREGLLYMTWSNGSLDWDASAKDKPEAVIQNVMDQLHPGANILMHELPWTSDALDDLLARLKDKGYGFIDPAAIEIPEQA